MFMGGVTLFVCDKDIVFSSLYNYNPCLNNLGGLLLRFSEKIIDSLKCCWSYRFASRMATDVLLTAVATHQCPEVNWKKLAVLGSSLSYDFYNGKVLGLDKASVQADRQASRIEDNHTMVSLPAVFVCFCAGVKLVDLALFSRAFQEYSRLRNRSTKAWDWNHESLVTFDALFDTN